MLHQSDSKYHREGKLFITVFLVSGGFFPIKLDFGIEIRGRNCGVFNPFSLAFFASRRYIALLESSNSLNLFMLRQLFQQCFIVFIIVANTSCTFWCHHRWTCIWSFDSKSQPNSFFDTQVSLFFWANAICVIKICACLLTQSSLR